MAAPTGRSQSPSARGAVTIQLLEGPFRILVAQEARGPESESPGHADGSGGDATCPVKSGLDSTILPESGSFRQARQGIGVFAARRFEVQDEEPRTAPRLSRGGVR